MVRYIAFSEPILYGHKERNWSVTSSTYSYPDRRDIRFSQKTADELLWTNKVTHACIACDVPGNTAALV